LVTPEGKPPGAPPGLIAIQLFGVSYGPPEPPLGFEAPQDFRTWFTINVLEGEPQLDEEGDTIGTTFVAQPTGPDGVGPPAGLYGEAPLSSLLPLRAEPGINGDHPAELLQLHGEAARKLQEFGEAQDGDPTAASGLFWRMLYFSASTVTTLGIGDIQPITPYARTIVTGEAILGLIFIGLFLNALANRVQRNNGEGPSGGRTKPSGTKTGGT
jgi:hypothetical protein